MRRQWIAFSLSWHGIDLPNYADLSFWNNLCWNPWRELSRNNLWWHFWQNIDRNGKTLLIRSRPQISPWAWIVSAKSDENRRMAKKISAWSKMDKEGTSGSGSGTGKMDHSGDFYSVVRTISLLVQWSEGPYIPLNCAIERAIAKQGINLIAKYKSQWLPESFDPETYLCFSFVFCCRIEIPGLATTYPIARLRVGSGGGRWVPLVRGWEQPRNGPIRYNPMDIHPITHFHPQPVPHPRKFE